jgi:AcrR family transcriptional regulator
VGRSEETRQYIIERAAPIFNMHGYEGTSMSQLTLAINMTKGAIYGNFKDKDEIAIEAFLYNVAQLSHKIEAALAAKAHACDKLVAFANFYLDEFAAISENGGCPILNAAIDSDNVHQDLKNHVVLAIEGFMNRVARIVYKGIQRKEINRGAKPEQFASVFISLIEGGLGLSKVTGNTIHLSRNIDHIIHLVNAELRR